MNRDMDLARNILLQIEAAPYNEVHLDLCGRNPDEIAYHVMLLAEAGLIEALDASGMGDFQWIPQRLTWEGHEFLDAARSETVWNRAKDLLKEKGGGTAFEVLKALLIQLAKQAVLGGLP